MSIIKVKQLNDDFKQKINGGFIWNIYDVHIAEKVMEMMIKF